MVGNCMEERGPSSLSWGKKCLSWLGNLPAFGNGVLGNALWWWGEKKVGALNSLWYAPYRE